MGDGKITKEVVNIFKIIIENKDSQKAKEILNSVELARKKSVSLI